MLCLSDRWFFFFFFNDTATTEIYTLSLHDALPIYHDRRAGALPRGEVLDPEAQRGRGRVGAGGALLVGADRRRLDRDRKSTRLNSSHSQISYAVFCLKKKKIYGKYYHWISSYIHIH